MPRKDDKAAIREELKRTSPDYFSVPRDLFWDDDLTALEQRLLLFIAHKDQGPRGCFASNTYLAAFANCAEKTITRAIEHFVERGFLFEVPWDGIERRLYVNDQYRPLLKGEYPKGRDKKSQGSGHSVPSVGTNCPSNMDESSEELYKRVTVARNGSEPDPSPEETEWALERLRAKHVPIRNPDSTAARELIREEVLRLRTQRAA